MMRSLCLTLAARRTRRPTLLFLIFPQLLLVLATAASAQEPLRVRSRWSGAVELLDTQPLGALATGPGVGLGVSGAWSVAPSQVLRLRAEFRGAIYGQHREEFCLAQPVGCWLRVGVSTTYGSFFFGLGPEVSLPLAGMELVLDGTMGVGYFGVSSSLDGADADQGNVFTTDHFHDAFLAWSTGGELRVPISSQLSVVVGTHYQHNGRASYVREGDITQNADGTLNVRSTTTDANMVAITLGIAVHPFITPQGSP